MPAPLNIRDIGADRKAALEREAALRDTSLANIVRAYIDAGIEDAERARAREAWIASARHGLADEAENLEVSGPSLARFRTP